MPRLKLNHCANGHAYNDTNTYTYRSNNGKVLRHCRVCALQKAKVRRLKHDNKGEPDSFYARSAKWGCKEAAKKAGHPVPCLDCPLDECVHVIQDAIDARVKVTV